MNSNTEKQYIIIGAGGHAAVIADILYQSDYSLVGFLDDNAEIGKEVLGASVIGKLEDCRDYPDCLFIIGVGDNSVRKEIAQSYPVTFGTAIHPSAVIGQQVELGAGSVIMAGCIINPRTVIGEHCIINTNSSIDHDNKLGDFVHISPGVKTGGVVTIGNGTHVGIGACVRNVVNICEGVLIGAGAVVVRDILEPGTYIGVPARRVE